MSHMLPAGSSPLDCYVSEINRFPLLSREEEYNLAMRYRRYNDLEAAHRLICCNLRFVLKIAQEYRNYGVRIQDLIQEGNIGLMIAVKKYDPIRGVRLISYAVRWIRAYIQDFIMRSWSLVKIGTTQAQRKLFYKLPRTMRALGSEGIDWSKVADSLGVDQEEARKLYLRKEERDQSLDREITGETETTHLELLPDSRPNQEELLAETEGAELSRSLLHRALKSLSFKERLIVEKRFLSPKPVTLQEIGSRLGISRERVRQIENAALAKLRKRMEELSASPPQAIPVPA